MHAADHDVADRCLRTWRTRSAMCWLHVTWTWRFNLLLIIRVTVHDVAAGRQHSRHSRAVLSWQLTALLGGLNCLLGLGCCTACL